MTDTVISTTDDAVPGCVITEDTHTSRYDHFWCAAHVPSYTRATPIVSRASFTSCEKCGAPGTLLTQDDNGSADSPLSLEFPGFPPVRAAGPAITEVRQSHPVSRRIRAIASQEGWTDHDLLALLLAWFDDRADSGVGPASGEMEITEWLAVNYASRPGEQP